MRGIAVVALALLSGCGSERPNRAHAAPATIELGWRETARLPQGAFVFRVERLSVGTNGWSVGAAVENRTPTTFIITRPKRRGGTSMGLVFFRTPSKKALAQRARTRALDPPLRAESFRPPLPRVLGPGAVWRGTFAGSGHLPAGSYVRVYFGHFANPTHRPDLFSWVTEHAHRL